MNVTTVEQARALLRLQRDAAQERADEAWRQRCEALARHRVAKADEEGFQILIDMTPAALEQALRQRGWGLARSA